MPRLFALHCRLFGGKDLTTRKTLHERGFAAALLRQLVSFVGVGSITTAIHYAILITLVQIVGVRPVPAALCGASAGAALSYYLNRRHTFASDRPHEEAVWRFAFVAGVAFLLTYLLMRQAVDGWHIPYLIAQLGTTLIVMFWSFLGNRLWTFRAPVT